MPARCACLCVGWAVCVLCAAWLTNHFDQDPLLSVKLGKWVETVTGHPCFDIYACLKNGIALCVLIDKIKPGIHGKHGYNKRATVHMAQRDNIKLYLTACANFGMASSELFEISDLHENRNIPSVISNLVSLSRRARFVEEFSGPYLEAEGISTAPIAPASEKMAPKSFHRRSRSGAGFATTASPSPQTFGGNLAANNNAEPYKNSAPEYKSSAPEFNLDVPAKPRNRNVGAAHKAQTQASSASSAKVPPRGSSAARSHEVLPNTQTSQSQKREPSLVSRLRDLQSELDALRAENEELRANPRGGGTRAQNTASGGKKGGMVGSLAGRINTRLQGVYLVVGKAVVWTGVLAMVAGTTYLGLKFRTPTLESQ
jgi:Calponin homology (CH) domain